MKELILQQANKLKAQKFPTGSTVGKCLEASVELADRLNDLDFNASPIYGNFNGMDHCWISVEVNGKEWYLDITADQFGYPGIIFCPLDEVQAEIEFPPFNELA